MRIWRIGRHALGCPDSFSCSPPPRAQLFPPRSPLDKTYKDSKYQDGFGVRQGGQYHWKKPSQGYLQRCFQGLQCPVLGAFLYSKRSWQQGMSHVYLCRGLHTVAAETEGSAVSVSGYWTFLGMLGVSI
eukprot:1145109-Pelagomonas_calceolata.AAC.6